MPAQNPEDIGPQYAQAFTRGDLDAVLACFEPGAAVPDLQGEVVSGTDAIREGLAPFVATKSDLTIETEKAIVAGDIALLHSRWNLTGPTPMSGRGREVARRQPDGTWLYVIDDPFTLGAE